MTHTYADAQRSPEAIQGILKTYVQGFKGQIKADSLPSHLMKRPSKTGNITFLPQH